MTTCKIQANRPSKYACNVRLSGNDLLSKTEFSSHVEKDTSILVPFHEAQRMIPIDHKKTHQLHSHLYSLTVYEKRYEPIRKRK